MSCQQFVIQVVLDSRETSLKKELDRLDLPFDVVQQQLVLGDVLFEQKCGCSQHEDAILLLCERKTYSDLYSSIISGRYAEQRERLKCSGIKSIYIVEGHVSKLTNVASTRGGEINVVMGALENLVLYHDINVLPTPSLARTALAVINIHKKLSENPVVNYRSRMDEGKVIMQRKEKLLDNIHLNQLALIPGVSVVVAKVIANIYPTVSSLIRAYDAIVDTTGKETMLADITLGKRKLGKVLSKRIYEIYGAK